MKKLLLLFVAVIATSCSSDDPNPVIATSQIESLSVLDGNLLSFKDEGSFIKEYSKLAELKSGKEIQAWITKKGHSSFLNSIDTTEVIQDKFDNTIIIYSDALKSIVNKDFKFKIEGKILWLNQRNLYVLSENDIEKSEEELEKLKSDLEVYGNVLGLKQNKAQKGNLTDRTIPNANRSKGWSYGYSYENRDRRIDLTLFNETIILNGNVKSTKMFLRCQRFAKFCSFWKCRWNSDGGGSVYLKVGGAIGNWGFNYNLITTNNFLGYELSDLNNTVLLADGTERPAPYILYSDNFVVNAIVTVNLLNDTNIGAHPSNIRTWNQNINWY